MKTETPSARNSRIAGSQMNYRDTKIQQSSVGLGAPGVYRPLYNPSPELLAHDARVKKYNAEQDWRKTEIEETEAARVSDPIRQALTAHDEDDEFEESEPETGSSGFTELEGIVERAVGRMSRKHIRRGSRSVQFDAGKCDECQIPITAKASDGRSRSYGFFRSTIGSSAMDSMD